MIRVIKPARAPAILRESNKRGPRETNALCVSYDDGNRDFEFTSSIYGAKSVKNALIKAQHGKCCFCESKITHIAYGDVEHFRPKGGFRQKSGDPLEKPGYYWLAYAWTNLFLSCQICNQRFKRNLFPLKKPSKRARSHHDDVGEEEPLFIDPSDDPERHIGFREEYPYAIDGNSRGSKTITALGLDRVKLEEMRRSRLAPVKLLRETARVLEDRKSAGDRLGHDESTLLRKIRNQLAQLTLDSAEYAAMMRAALGS